MAQRNSGSVLDGKYEIVERLATGGMGEVYRARHVHLHEDRVIKILRADKAADPQALQRFQQEARIATQIKHPNVAILYDFARLEDGSFYMVWEHIAGEDVGSALRRHGPFRSGLAVELTIQALRGLDAIHTAGVIHRDLSPDNLMITRDRRGQPLVKIIDLGLAKDLEKAQGSEITQAGMFMGKLLYCSPEQAGALPGAALDHRSDLYSLAAVLYEMVTGKTPFDSESQHGHVLKRLSEPPIPMTSRSEGISVPKALDEVVLRGLERDREKRWPDALSFLHALVRVADHLRQVSTQEIPAQKRDGEPGAPAARPASSVSTRPASRPGTSELSREERMDLLAQIDRAAKKVSDAGRLQERARRALAAGERDEAAELLAQLEVLSPRHPGLAELRAAMAPAVSGGAEARRAAAARPATAPEPVSPPPSAPPQAVPAAPSAPAAPTEAELDRRARIAEAERLLEKYIREHKQSLARFALDALLDLMPNHPKRDDYESWVSLMGEEIEALRGAETALEDGRAALLRGELEPARTALAEIERLDPSHHLPDLFRAEIEEAEARLRSSAEVDRRRQRLESLLDERRLADAERELERLSGSGLARVSVESYRLRIQDIAALAARDARSEEFEKRYRERVQAKDWAAARETVLEFEQAVPDSARPAHLFAEVSRLEEIERKQKGIEQGLRQLEQFLAQRKAAEAEMAFRILSQMAPDLPQLGSLGERVRALRGA